MKYTQMLSESIYDDGHVLIPMADVQHIEYTRSRTGEPDGIYVIMKSTRWNYDDNNHVWNNPIHIPEERKAGFLAAYCYFRHEIDGIDNPTSAESGDNHNSNKENQ